MKRIITVLTAILVAGSAFITSSAAQDNRLTWEKAVALLDSGSTTLKKLDNAEKQSARQYVDSTISSRAVNTEGMNITVMGREVFIGFDNYTKMLLTQQKELTPEQMLYAWDMSKVNKTVTRNSLITALRGVYAGLYSAAGDYRSKQGKLDLSKAQKQQADVKYKNGMISDLDLEEAVYNLSKAQQEYDSSARSLENATRSFNSFVGANLETTYSDVLYSDTYTPTKMRTLADYLEAAQKQRPEITSPERQLAMDAHKKTIMEKNQVYQIYTAAMKDYASLLVDMENLKSQQEKAKLEVEKDVRYAYADVVKAGKSVENMKKTVDLQKSNLDNMNRKFKAGLISSNVFKQVELGFADVELGYRMSVFDYNTKLLKLQYAAGVGPGYAQ